MPVGKRTQSKRAAPGEFVLDCSVVFAWYFADKSNPYADAVASSLVRAHALVPSLWPLEVANTLLTGERRKRSTEAQASSFLPGWRLFPSLWTRTQLSMLGHPQSVSPEYTDYHPTMPLTLSLLFVAAHRWQRSIPS